MIRKPIRSAAWDPIIEALGSADAVCSALGLSKTTFNRIRRGVAQYPVDKIPELDVLCELKDVESPLEATQSRSRNLKPLRLIGEAIERGFPVSPSEVERVRGLYHLDQLIQLAESDDTPPNVLRGVQRVLDS